MRRPFRPDFARPGPEDIASGPPARAQEQVPVANGREAVLGEIALVLIVALSVALAIHAILLTFHIG